MTQRHPHPCMSLFGCLFVVFVISLNILVSTRIEWTHGGWENVSPSVRSIAGSEESGIQKATRILYERSNNLDFWLQQPPPKVYIYDTLDMDEFSVDSLSKCINRRFNSGKQRATCGWEPVVCDENSTSSYGPYNAFRDNFNSDIFLISSFEKYEHRTKNPAEADFFFVPYAHKSHCFCKNDNEDKIWRCSYGFDVIQKNVMDKLPYYNETTEARHLFLLGSDFAQSMPGYRKRVPFHVSTGPANGCHRRKQPPDVNCGSLTIPFVSTDAAHQPDAVTEYLAASLQGKRTTRKFSVAAVMGTPPQLVLRRSFMEERESLLGDSVGGLPVSIHNIGERNRYLNSRQEVLNLYRNAVFVPIFPGDDCGQKRFFDAIFSGSIPMVVSYDSSDEPNFPSFFKPNACSIRRSYPFMVGTFHRDLSAGIDVRDLVVQVNGTACGLECVKETLEEVMSDGERLAKIRTSIHRVASLFAYRAGPIGNRQKSPDVFDALMVSVRHYLANLP